MSGPAAANGAIRALPGHEDTACGCIRGLFVFGSSGQYLFIRELHASPSPVLHRRFVHLSAQPGRAAPRAVSLNRYTEQYTYTFKWTMPLRIGWQQPAPARRSSLGTHHAIRLGHVCAYTIDCFVVPSEQQHTKELSEETTRSNNKCVWVVFPVSSAGEPLAIEPLTGSPSATR